MEFAEYFAEMFDWQPYDWETDPLILDKLKNGVW